MFVHFYIATHFFILSYRYVKTLKYQEEKYADQHKDKSFLLRKEMQALQDIVTLRIHGQM